MGGEPLWDLTRGSPPTQEERHTQTFKQVAYPHTARIIRDGTVYIKNEQPAQYAAWKEIDEITAASFYLEGDSVNIQA